MSVIDGTKYLTGEFYQGTVTVGDSRMQLTMPRDDETVVLNRGFRFLIDDPGATEPQAYEITKINRTGKVFDGHGVFVHMLSECNRNAATDNYDLMIADYYTKLAKFEIRLNDTDGKVSLQAGDTFQIDADVLRNKEPVDGISFSFSSSDDSIATVSDTGLIEAVSSGECDIALSYHELQSSVHIYVVESSISEPPHFVLDCAETGIPVGASVTIPVSFFVDDIETVCGDAVVTLDVQDSIASASFDNGVITVTATRNRKNIGAVFTVTISSESYDTSSSLQFTVRGWI